MIRIDKAQWIPDLFAHVKVLGDVLTEPNENWAALSTDQLNKIRNTQALEGDVVRILGHHHDFSLIMKIDGAKGWMHNSWIEENKSLRGFVKPIGGLTYPRDLRAFPICGVVYRGRVSTAPV